MLGPGVSQYLFTFAVRDAGAARTSVVIGTAPLFSIAIAVVLLGEPLEAALVAGAILIVAGGSLLVSERERPEHFKVRGLGLALVATIIFAARDNLVRWLSIDTDVSPGLAALATLAAGAVVMTVFVLVSRAPLRAHDARAFAPAGVVFGLSYICLFEAYYRGLVTVVSPLVATESLWGVAAGGGRPREIGARRSATRRGCRSRRRGRRGDRHLPLAGLPLDRVEPPLDARQGLDEFSVTLGLVAESALLIPDERRR